MIDIKKRYKINNIIQAFVNQSEILEIAGRQSLRRSIEIKFIDFVSQLLTRIYF